MASGSHEMPNFDEIELQTAIMESFKPSGQSSNNYASPSTPSQSNQPDEAYAISAMYDDFDTLHISNHPIGAPAETRTGNPTPPPSPARVTTNEPSSARDTANVTEDDVDPDNMTYEELQTLGDNVGHESKGLSDETISRLPTSKHKVRLFTKKKKRISTNCVICCSGYVYGNKLTTLPCAHLYHSKCITTWLKENNACPVCLAKVDI